MNAGALAAVKNWWRRATEPRVHRYGYEGVPTGRCRLCGYPCSWMCFTCRYQVCSYCIESHAGGEATEYVPPKQSTDA